ncbi:MAG: ankyrin repeat domain-containing protein [Sumerlaeia bacterium]
MLKLFISLSFAILLMACQQQSATPTVSIHDAALRGDVAALKTAVTQGADLDEKDAFGGTALLTAIAFDHTEAAQFLIASGAGLEVRNNDGSTALHAAALFGRTEVVESLLEAGADPAAKNNMGATPFDLAAAPFESMVPVYDYLKQLLGPMGLDLNYETLKRDREAVVRVMRG